CKYTLIYAYFDQQFRTGVYMPFLQTQNKKERLSFLVDSELSNKVNRISKQTNLTVSDIVRKALQNFIVLVEKEKTDKELEAGYKANYNYYLKTQDEWKYADKG
ncbi:MAG: ribbon-helix-helix domain-containing protein, partial [Ignavibacteriaceae bacterium]